MKNTCDIIAHRKNKEGKRVPSALHLELLSLGKFTGTFDRELAKNAYYLSIAPSFRDDYSDTLQYTEDNEVTLMSLYDATWDITTDTHLETNSIFPNVSYTDMREYLADKFKEGPYEYEEAVKKAISFNEKHEGGRTFIGIITLEGDSNSFKIAYNTAEVLEEFILILELNEAKKILIEKLKKAGVGIVKGSKSVYNTMNPKRLVNGLLGVIQLRENSSLGELANETGHFIIESLGRENTLVSRLYKLVEAKPFIFLNLLGKEEYDRYTSDSLLDEEEKQDELVGHLVGKYLEKKVSDPELSGFRNLVDRIIDYVKSHFTFSDREYKMAMYEAKWTAMNLVSQFMGDSFKGTLKTALQSKKVLEGHRRNILSAVTEITKQFHLTVDKFKSLDISDIKKLFEETFNAETLALNKIAQLYQEVSTNKRFSRYMGTEYDDTAQEQSIEKTALTSFISTLGFLNTHLKQALSALVYATLYDTMPNGTTITLSNHASIIKYNQEVLKLATEVRDTVDKLLNAGIYPENKTYSTAMEELKEQMNILLLGPKLTGLGDGSSIKRQYDRSYELALLECRRSLAQKLLTKINGDSFLILLEYVTINDWKLCRHKPSKITFNDEWNSELIRTDINPYQTWIARYIDGMADNPDLINQMTADLVELKKYEANKKTLDLKDRLFNMYQLLRTITYFDNQGVKKLARHTEIFFERFSKVEADGAISYLGKTGNLLSSRNYGAWEVALKETIKKASDRFYKLNIIYTVNINGVLTLFKYGDKITLTSEDGITKLYEVDNEGYDKAYLILILKALKENRTFNSIGDMYSDARYVAHIHKIKTNWHKKNSVWVDILDSNNQPVFDPATGQNKKMRVPAISTDRTKEGLVYPNTYDNPLYEFLNDPRNSELRKWYDEYLKLKRSLDEQLPDYSTNPSGLRAPLFYGTTANSLKAASQYWHLGSVKTIATTLWRNMVTSEDPYEFGGDHTAYDLEDILINLGLIWDHAHSNALSEEERLPMYGIKKLLNLDELSTDLIQSTLAYGLMAYNHNALFQYVEALELMKEVLKNRKNQSDYALKDIDDSVGSYGRYVDYLKLYVYNDYRITFINKSKVYMRGINYLARFTSLWYLGGNIHSAMTNVATGFWEILKECLGEYFTKRHFVAAWLSFYKYKLQDLGQGFKRFFTDYGSIRPETSKYALLRELFDITNDNNRLYKHFNILTTGYSLLKGATLADTLINWSMLPYSLGDEWMQAMAYIATAMNTPLYYKGDPSQKSTLWDIIDSKEGKLVFKKGSLEDWYIKDESIERAKSFFEKEKAHGEDLTPEQQAIFYKENLIPFDSQLQSRFKVRCRRINNRMHGVYNQGDAGAYTGMLYGPLFAMLKKYAIGLIDRRFSKARIDFTDKNIRLGTTTTALDITYDLLINSNPKGIKKSSHEWVNTLEQTAGLRQVFGVFELIYLISASMIRFLTTDLGPITKTRYDILARRGYSPSLIKNFDRCVADSISLFLNLILLSCWAPPEDEEGVSFDIEYDSIWGAGKFLRWLYTGFLQNTPLAKTIDDKTLLDPEYMANTVWEASYVIPFSLKSILYYQTYRTLKEQYAYNIFTNPNNSWLQEARSVAEVYGPGFAGAADIIKIFNIILQLSGTAPTYKEWEEALNDPNLTKDDLNALKRLDYAEMSQEDGEKLGKGMEIYTKGQNKNWYKYAMLFAKHTPLIRSLVVYNDPVMAAYSMEYATKSTILKSDQALWWLNTALQYYNQNILDLFYDAVVHSKDLEDVLKEREKAKLNKYTDKKEKESKKKQE